MLGGGTHCPNTQGQERIVYLANTKTTYFLVPGAIPEHVANINSLIPNNTLGGCYNCPQFIDKENEVERGDTATNSHMWSMAPVSRTRTPPLPKDVPPIPGACEYTGTWQGGTKVADKLKLLTS